MSSSSNSRRTRRTKKSFKSGGGKVPTGTRTPPKSKSPTKTSPKSSKSPTKTTKKAQSLNREDSKCGSIQEQDKRRSLRLRGKSRATKKRTRSSSSRKEEDVSSPPKKRVKRTPKPKNKNMASPKGIKTSPSKSKEKKKTSKRRRRYKLLDILRHKLTKDLETVLGDSVDKLWYESIDYAPIQQLLKQNWTRDGAHDDEECQESDNEDEDVKEESNHGSNSNNNMNDEQNTTNGMKNAKEEKEDEAEQPQFCFGKIMFECKWEGMLENTWECWETLSETDLFKTYREKEDWKNELRATIEQHSEEEVTQIILNMAIYGAPTTRKALKILFGEGMGVW